MILRKTSWHKFLYRLLFWKLMQYAGQKANETACACNRYHGADWVALYPLDIAKVKHSWHCSFLERISGQNLMKTVHMPRLVQMMQVSLHAPVADTMAHRLSKWKPPTQITLATDIMAQVLWNAPHLTCFIRPWFSSQRGQVKGEECMLSR